MRPIITSLFLFLSFAAFAQGIMEGIPDSLKKDANEIVLFDESSFVINNLESATFKNHYKAIIVNKKAEDRNVISLYYSNFREIVDAEVITYNMLEIQSEKFKLKDFNDFSTKGGSIADDSRVKHLEVIAKTYPYIIEVSYELKYSGSMFFPTWIPQSGEKQAVVSASLTVESKLENGFREKSINTSPIADGETLAGKKMKWEVKNLKPFEYESFSPGIEYYAPVVYLAPNDFQMEGYVGNMSTWNDFGIWQKSLLKGQNTLSPDVLSELKSRIPANANKLEKTKIIYDYMQENTRYVSVQLGIGGWQPFPSGFVHEKKYGDCKALSFYTQSLLEAVGVKSHYTMISAGYEPGKTLHRDFPASTFNHAILTVPLEKDTVWLECTSQSNPFGFMGTFTSDRDAVIITDEGAQVIHTKSYKAHENIQSTDVSLEIKKDGSAVATVVRTYNGLEVDNKDFSDMAIKPKTDQEKWYYDRFDWGTSKLKSLELVPVSNERVPVGQMKAEIEFTGMATSSSDRLFYKPFVFTNLNSLKLSNDKRLKPVEIRYPYTEQDSLLVTFPEGYFLENLPKDIELSTPYGKYERSIAEKDGKYLITRKFIFNKGIYPAESYEDFKSFVKDVQKYDKEKLVMINKT